MSRRLIRQDKHGVWPGATDLRCIHCLTGKPRGFYYGAVGIDGRIQT